MYNFIDYHKAAITVPHILNSPNLNLRVRTTRKCSTQTTKFQPHHLFSSTTIIHTQAPKHPRQLSPPAPSPPAPGTPETRTNGSQQVPSPTPRVLVARVRSPPKTRSRSPDSQTPVSNTRVEHLCRAPVSNRFGRPTLHRKQPRRREIGRTRAGESECWLASESFPPRVRGVSCVLCRPMNLDVLGCCVHRHSLHTTLGVNMSRLAIHPHACTRIEMSISISKYPPYCTNPSHQLYLPPCAFAPPRRSLAKPPNPHPVPCPHCSCHPVCTLHAARTASRTSSSSLAWRCRRGTEQKEEARHTAGTVHTAEARQRGGTHVDW